MNHIRYQIKTIGLKVKTYLTCSKPLQKDSKLSEVNKGQSAGNKVRKVIGRGNHRRQRLTEQAKGWACSLNDRRSF